MQSMVKRLIERRCDSVAGPGLLGLAEHPSRDDATAAWLAWLGVRHEPEQAADAKSFGFADTAVSLHDLEVQ